MNRSIHRISLDIHKVGSQTALNVKKGDTARSICITLTENGRPYEIVENCSAVFSAKKPDGNFILNDCVIQGNEIVYDFTPQTAPVAGAMECEVSLYDKSGNQITSPRFLVVVDEVVYNDEDIVSSNEANFLKELISEVNSTVNEIEAKLANGEFVGEKGEKGDKGDKGDAGVDGTEGQDGVSATHEWNGTVLTVTSASGTSSADLKGEPGNDGYTPIKGFDYFTDSEQAEFIAKTAPAITCQASGDVITLSDSSDLPLRDLKVYGKTMQEGTPSPENPQSMDSVGEDGFINCSVTGKNVYADGDISVYEMKNRMVLSAPIPAGTYTVSVEFENDSTSHTSGLIFFIYANGTNFNASFAKGGRASRTVTFTDTVTQLSFYAANNATASVGVTASYTRIQIELGSTATEYESYQSQSVTIPTPNGLRGVPVNSGGNYTDANGQQWVCDEVDFKRGVYVQRVAQKVLNGTEYWEIFAGTREDGSDWYYHSEKISGAVDNGSSYSLICNQYPTNYLSNNTSWQGIGMVWRNVRVRWGTPLTIDEWKAQLAENPITIQYVLAEPVEIPLDEATLSAFSALHTNKPNTTILNDSGAWMSAEYVADTKLYIDNKFAELAAAIVSNS